MANTRATDPPLSVLLSQALVAFAIEFDIESDARMRERGHPGFASFAAWRNVLRYLGTGGAALRELTTVIPVRPADVKFILGCLERWGFVAITPPDAAASERTYRVGFGSSRGFSSDWRIAPTPRTLLAFDIWPAVLQDIHVRWQARFGPARVEDLRAALLAIVESFDTVPPEALPDRAARPWAVGSLIGPSDDWAAAPRSDDEAAALPVLLSRALWTFAVMFDREAPVPLAIAAGLLRVLDADAKPVTGLPLLLGRCATNLSTPVLKSGLLEVVAGKGGARGRLVRLTPRGIEVKHACEQVIQTIDRRFRERYGRTPIERLRAALNAVRDHHDFGEGMRPPPGLPRSGTYTPGFDVGPPGVMKSRAKALIAQTKAFTTDPRATLPHYPVWDGNAGFGP